MERKRNPRCTIYELENYLNEWKIDTSLTKKCLCIINTQLSLNGYKNSEKIKLSQLLVDFCEFAIVRKLDQRESVLLSIVKIISQAAFLFASQRETLLSLYQDAQNEYKVPIKVRLFAAQCKNKGKMLSSYEKFLICKNASNQVAYSPRKKPNKENVRFIPAYRKALKRKKPDTFGICAICKDNKSEFMSWPCSHVSYCQECKNIYIEKQIKLCCLCQQRISFFHKVYVS